MTDTPTKQTQIDRAYGDLLARCEAVSRAFFAALAEEEVQLADMWEDEDD